MILPPAKGRRPPLGETSWDFGLIASLTWLPYFAFEKLLLAHYWPLVKTECLIRGDLVTLKPDIPI